MDEEAVRAWVESKETAAGLQDQKWVDAWQAYQDAITAPWNAFLDRAEQISDEDIKIGMQTDQEYITFIAENTFVDGKSLKEVFPQIEEFLAYYRDSESAIDDKYFNFDAFRMTPRTLGKRSGYIDAEGVYHPNQAMADGWEDSGDESEEDGESDGDDDAGEQLEQVMDKIGGAVVSYGYDPEVVKAWLQDKSTTWEGLQEASH